MSSSTPEPAASADDAAPAPQIPDDRVHSISPETTIQQTTTTEVAGLPHSMLENTRRCFICLVDEPEDQLPADWSTPCTCTLQGHQQCLLAWVTDLESQNKEVKCPLCKSKIRVVDRWDSAIQMSDSLTRLFSAWSPIILVLFCASGAVASSALYGFKAIETLAGPEAALRYLLKRPFNDEGYLEEWIEKRMQTIGPVVDEQSRALLHETLRWNAPMDPVRMASLPLVGPMLVLNRMHLGEVVLIPTSLLYTMFFISPDTQKLTWPPPPQQVLALFPAVKAMYFHLYRSIVGGLDKKWEAMAAAPATLRGEAPEQIAGRQDPEDRNDGDEGNIIDIQINLGGDDIANPGGAQNRLGNAGVRSPLNFIAGALLWPGVSYGMGELLRLLLPKTWVTRPDKGPITGLLQERWGRSLAGGCLFVVLKDAFFLYVKYRRAINRPHRRIKNSDRRRRRD